MSVVAPQGEVATGRRARLPSLTGMRFFAALLVFLFHITLLQSNLVRSPNPPHLPVKLSPFADQGVAHSLAWLFSKCGFVGVSFFFVLSGFVLTWSTRPGERATAFWRRRVLKIFPNHIVVWGLILLVSGGLMSGWLPNLFLIHGFFPNPAIFSSVNQVSWSLSCELLFYVLFPFIIRPIMRIGEHRLWLWAGLMVVGIGMIRLIDNFLIPATPSPGWPMPVTQFWFEYFFPPTRLFEFVLGMLMARIVLSGRWPNFGLLPALGLAVVGYTITLFVPFPYGLNLTMIIPICAVVGATARIDVREKQTWLRSRLMVFLGNVSFGFYLAQGLVIFYGRLFVDSDHRYSVPVAILVAIGFWLAVEIVGALLYLCVERPIMRRWSRSRKSRPAAPVATSVAPVGLPAEA